MTIYIYGYCARIISRNLIQISHIWIFFLFVSDLNSANENTDEEEELDLLFDPVLNCYFDPKTQKYYELRF